MLIHALTMKRRTQSPSKRKITDQINKRFAVVRSERHLAAPTKANNNAIPKRAGAAFPISGGYGIAAIIFKSN